MTMLQTGANGVARSSGQAFAPIAKDLLAVEQVLIRRLSSPKSHVSALTARVDQYRGKRLRPALLLLTARACGNVAPAHHILGAVVEMVHTATLVHDDVLDAASLRRHVRTVNADWGNQAAVLLGDMLFSQAFFLASTVDARACSIIGAATNRVCEGELHQVTQRGNLELSEEDYFDIVDGKTAELTACSSKLGAMYADGDEEVVQKMTSYGRSLGIAFQIADDVLDLTGIEDTTGKTLGTDLAQGKMTLPLIRLLEALPSSEAADVRELLAQTDVPRDRISRLLRETDALGYSRRRAKEFADAARQSLEVLPPSECRTILEGLTDWSIRREK